MQTFSLLWGMVAIFGMMIGFVPCLGLLNWFVIPFACLGLLLSIIAFATAKDNESKGGSIAGILCCIVTLFFSLFRLVIGGGVL